MKPSLARTLSLVSLVSLSIATASAWATCELKHFEIPVRLVDQRPVATLTLNGTAASLLVDSGAFFSMLSASTATQLKLPLRDLPDGFRVQGYTGRIEVQRTVVDKVGLIGAELPKIEFLVGGNELGAGIQGILGRNILSVADTEYDLAHGVVRLSFPKGDCEKTDFAYWAGPAPVIVVPLEDKQRGNTAIRTMVGINGKDTLALFDTGAPRTSLTLKAARRAGLEERDLTPAGRSGGGGEGRVRSWTGSVARFDLGGEKITGSRLQIDDTSSPEQGMLIGLDYFLSHRIYVSRLQRQLYITWNGNPIFAPSSAASSGYDTRYAALPQDVVPDDADALARRGAAALAAGNPQRALEDLNRACALAPAVADCFFTRARVHLAMRRARPGLADLDEALRLDPALAEARARRVGLRAQLGDRPGAQSDLAQLDAALPPSHQLRAAMAQLWAGLGQTDEALRQFELWIGSHPLDASLPNVLNHRCWMRTRLNLDLMLALQDCKRALDKDAGEPAHHNSLGWTYLRLGDAQKAKQAFDSAIKLRAHPFALYGRGLAQLRLDETSSGESDLAAARKLRPPIADELRKEGFEFDEATGRPKPAPP